MAQIIVYRQKRVDGGVRTGIDLDDQTLAEQFEEGTGERDPALLWFVDLRAEGPGVPDESDAAEAWLVAQSTAIIAAFTRYAETLRVGADADDYVLKWNEFPDAPSGVKMSIVASASRRVDAREFATILGDTAAHWHDRLQSLLSVGQAAE